MQTEEVQVMTVEEVSEYLRIPRSSLYKLAQEGRIPCQKVGRHWRFHRGAINSWLQANQKSEGHESSAANTGRPSEISAQTKEND
jgi:excisionase family DNA binding protein